MLSINPGLRHVREAILKIGYRFSLNEPKAYFAWPIMGLFEIYKSKTIPYADTLSMLRTVESESPGGLTLYNLLAGSSPNRSPILHESLHCLSHWLAGGRTNFISGSGRADPKTVFELILNEAITNAGETLVNMFALDPLHSILLTKWHSQVIFSAERLEWLANLSSKYGQQFVFRLLVLSYTMFNFMVDDVGKAELSKVISFLDPPGPLQAQDTRRIRSLAADTMRMRPTARVLASFNFMKNHGIVPFETPEEYTAYILKIDYFKILSSGSGHQNLIQSVGDIFENGAESRFLSEVTRPKRAA